MDLGLDGRTVIVTGASGGIGREVARGFAAEGADVVLTYRSSPEEAGQVAKEIGERALVVPYDLGDSDSARTLVSATLEWTGRIDVLVNNALFTVGWSPGESFEKVPDEAWREMLRRNVEGYLDLSRLVTPGMRERRFGRLVHISSGLVDEGMAGSEYYTTAKAAVHGFSRSAAFSLGRDGDILSNVVLPGLTATERNQERIEPFSQRYVNLAAIGRLLDAREVANAVVYLGSAANTGITGQTISVTGGV
ncbi:SDR family NAD(P)-dependent oxidoreductase [Streptosporangium saharense]|uniref:NAD(P)-dependent dehydrogenase (Short-subunit alcohol dehydrogenase family) n=1 Tax=Streptosporangium saharense TaxID=1706840 RepID=A0A7W7QPR5_9ACTN|nr:SDR family oxidoreductase [Streptosporangium saharense]MBB4917393.1 NAD(P)-dependent dehydrogenase (short-subunit alcohol dehydrogenase family) [Streptosporangium saharense]